MPKLIDLTNKKFGKLTVDRKGPSKNGHVYWYCSCDCGRTKDYLVQGNHLKNGHTIQCPLCRKDNRQNLIVKQKHSTKKTKCAICGKGFIPNSQKRKYCYECSPTSSKKGRAATITCMRKAAKKALVKYKGGKCSICGYNKSLNALHFHHLDSSMKDFEVADAYSNGQFDMEKMRKEVDKCILVCANCHAELHDKELQDFS